MASSRAKSCIVPSCRSNSLVTPNVTFFNVPADTKRRKQWFSAAGMRNKYPPSGNHYYCCQLHFHMPNDAENYMKWKIMGPKVKLKLKPNVVPHKFPNKDDCSDTTPEEESEDEFIENSNTDPTSIEDLMEIKIEKPDSPLLSNERVSPMSVEIKQEIKEECLVTETYVSPEYVSLEILGNVKKEIDSEAGPSKTSIGITARLPEIKLTEDKSTLTNPKKYRTVGVQCKLYLSTLKCKSTQCNLPIKQIILCKRKMKEPPNILRKRQRVTIEYDLEESGVKEENISSFCDISDRVTVECEHFKRSGSGRESVDSGTQMDVKTEIDEELGDLSKVKVEVKEENMYY